MNQAELDRLLSDETIRRYYEETYDALLKQFEEKDEKMKQEFKVGDFVKLPHWEDYFKVTLITEKEIEVVEEGKYCTTYSLNTGFIKKEEPVVITVKNKIDPNKKYRKVGTHEPVRIICTDRVTEDDYFPVIVLIPDKDGIEMSYCLDAYGNSMHNGKIIEEIPQTDWSKVQVDTLIWVAGIPRYFHAYSRDDDMVLYFRDGATSITSTNGVAWTFSHLCSLEKPND